MEENINFWILEDPSWFDVGLIPDDLLSDDVLNLEGGASKRRRSSFSLLDLGRLAADEIGAKGSHHVNSRRGSMREDSTRMRHNNFRENSYRETSIRENSIYVHFNIIADLVICIDIRVDTLS